jgi:hypothetical protein
MLPRSLRIRIGDVVIYEGNVHVVKRIFNDWTFILRGILPFYKDVFTFTVRYIDSDAKFNRITFLQI